MNKKLLDTEGAEIAAGAGLVGTDLGVGAGGAVEVGGLEPGVDMHGGMGDTPLVGQLESALGTAAAHGTAIELERLDIRQVDGHIEALVGHGIRVVKSGIRTGDAQEVAVDVGSHIVWDIARPLCQQQSLRTEGPRIRILIPTQSSVVPVGFDKGVARSLYLCFFGDTIEAEIDGIGQLR